MQRFSVLRVLGILAIGFGLLTIRAGASALFGAGASGPVVPFVLWFNFLAGFAYVAAGVGLVLRRRWGERVAVGLALATLAVFAVFGVHVAHGGAYATRTVGALTLRTGFWLAAALIARSAFRAPTTGAHR